MYSTHCKGSDPITWTEKRIAALKNILETPVKEKGETGRPMKGWQD
jgi:hypothetical protein